MASPDVISLTPHHAKHYAHDLIRRAASGMDRLSTALFDASVDLNPHQIEAALFALQNRLTIESGEGSPTVEQGFACVFRRFAHLTRARTPSVGLLPESKRSITQRTTTA
jgi:hypothetical protein